MKKMLVPYIKSSDEYDGFSYTKLNFTGKWKSCFTKYGNVVIYVQHKTFIPFIKFWIHENYIEFMYPENTIIYCNK